MSNFDRITKKNLSHWLAEAQERTGRLDRELADAKRQVTLLDRALDDARAENARLRAARPRGVRVVTADDTFAFPAATDWTRWDDGISIMAGNERIAHVLADDIRVVTFLDETGASA